MSVNMLGVEDGDQEMDDRKDVDILVKSPESSKTKKSSPSIKSFFQPKESPDHEPANKKDIKFFFIAQNQSPTNEKTAEVQLTPDSDSNGNAAPRTEKFAKGSATGSTDVDKCRAEKQDEHGNSSSKKPKPKWSLLWKPKKSKDGDSNSEDFVELSNDEENGQNTKKSKSRKSKTEQNDVTFCNKGKAMETELKDDEKKEKKKKKTKMREVGNTSMENKNGELKDEITIIRDDDQSLSKETIVDKEDIVEVLSDISESKIESKTPTISSNSQTKTVRSAFDVLMSPNKSHTVDDDVKSIESVTIEDVSSPTHTPDQKSKDQVIIDCSSKSPSLESPGSGNAFDVLMTKKKPNENSSNSKKSPQKSKLHPAKFKLNIRYSRPSEFRDTNDVGDDDDEILVSHKAEKQTSGGGTSKKNKKAVHNEKTASTKKLKEATDDAKAQVKKTKSKPHPEIDQSQDKLSTKNTEPDVVSITYISEDTLEVVEEPRKMTKVKKKKKKKKKSKTRGSKPESFATIEVQEDSNSSVQEVLSSDVTVGTPKTGSHHSSSEIISPGSDDFEVMPKRTGLRKRNPKSYTNVNETESIVVEDKKKKKEKKEEKEEKEPGSPEVEMVMMCKTTKQEKDHKNTEPKKLASIFLKKPKTIEKKEPATDKMTSNETMQPKDDGNSKMLDETELKAANMAFNALFATCRTTKATVPAVQLCQLPAPWPSVSHVTQKDEDQSDEGFWKLNDSKIDSLPWKPELDLPRLKTRAIQLGEFTSSLNQNKNSEDGRQLIQTVSPVDCLSTAAVKKLLSEVSCRFPGVPIKRLYKQYKNKEGKKGPENLTETSKEQKEDIKAKDGKGCIGKSEERLQKGRVRPKRKISIESGDELIEKQQKKVPRTNEKEDKKNREKVQEVENKSESSRRSRKKPVREEEEEVPNEQNAKRKSSRLQKHCKNDKNKEESKDEEKSVESSKRKKRKTMDDEGIPKQVVEKGEKSEDSRSSLDEKRNPDKRELLWTEKYQPECSSEVMGNASSVSRLRSWLEAWKIKREKTLRKEIEMQKRLLAKQKNKDSSEKKLAWWEEDQDSDFHLSDEDSDDSGNEESGMCNAMLVVGPKGAGKTAAVYACAKELGYKVFEVNGSSKRSNKQILSRLEEATQSHLVITNPSANTPKASAFGGLFGSLSDKPATPSPMSNFFKKSNENQQEKNSKNQRSKKGGQEKSEKEKERKNKGKVKEEKGKDSAQAVGSMSDSNSMPALSLKAASLILFEEVDVIFEDDKGFWSAVTSFMRNAKCPIIMTSNDSRVDCDGRYEQLMIRSPSINLLSAHLLVTALVNDVFVNPAELKTLASWYQCDIRKCLLALQLWILSGGGVKISWEEFLRIQKDRKDPTDVQGSLEIKTDGEKKVQNPSNAGEFNQCMVEQPLGLDDPGEESLFLSVDDWKTLAKRPARATRRGQQCPASASDFQNEDSDFEPTKSSSHPPTDENTHSDSILEINEPADSQSMQIPDSETKKVSMPDVHCLLVEHALGLTNCTCGYRNGCMELLKDVGISSDKDYQFKRRCNLTYNTQMMAINLMSNNLPTLLPCLHSSHSPNPRPVTKATKETADSGNVNSMFSDKSLFDDGTSETPTKKGQKEIEEANKEPAEKLNNPDVVAMTMDKNDDVGITTQHSKTKDTAKEFQGEALEVFSSLAEDLSFMDAYVPEIATDVCSHHVASFGWWHGHARAGLSDDIITVSKHCDWSTCDTNACIRGALEVASLENSYTRYNSLVEKKQKYDGDEDLDDYLPYKEENSVVNLTGLNDKQSSKLSSRNKLYKSVNSSLPLVTHCTHHAVSVDYLPTLRSICHTERLREQANTKRRFLHYLDSNSLCINKSSQQSMADVFLAPH